LPSLALNGTYGVGEGAALTASGLRALDAAASPSFLLMNVALGVRLTTLNHRYSDIASTLGPQRPADIQSYANVRSTPLALSALLAVLGIGVLAHLLVTSVRARRRDLAVLKTLGLARRQVRAAVVWQATTLVVLALAVGVPLGLVAGRWTWKGFADSLGLDPNAAVPFAAIALLVLGAIVIGNIVAALPSRTAARTRPAAVLRSE
jgi:ABC-type antimicrobial peptide transport system permease subunit